MYRMVKDLVMINDYSQIKQVVSALVHDFALSSSANSRKGGLVGLAATAIALGRVSGGERRGDRLGIIMPANSVRHLLFSIFSP